MVLWEVTLATAYFLGLPRTYRLALKIQRKLISPKHPRIRQFVHRRIRTVFDVALKVHKNIQERDIEVGRNLGNRILRWLDRMKPSAQIRVPPPPGSASNSASGMSMKQIKSSANQKSSGNFSAPKNGEFDRHLFSSRVMWSRPFPTMAMVMRPGNPMSGLTQHRHLSTSRLEFPTQQFGTGNWDGVIRKDIMQWMMHK